MKAEQLRGENALWARITALEAHASATEKECEERIERNTKRYDAKIDDLVAKFEAQISIFRHERNNLRAGFNALISLIKRVDDPKLSSIAEVVEDMVARGDQPIAIEKAAFAGLKSASAAIDEINETEAREAGKEAE